MATPAKRFRIDPRLIWPLAGLAALLLFNALFSKNFFVIEVRDGVFDTRNQLLLHDLGITPDDEGEFSATFGVSVSLALALLRDPAGDIALSVPVEFGNDENVHEDICGVVAVSDSDVDGLCLGL